MQFWSHVFRDYRCAKEIAILRTPFHFYGIWQTLIEKNGKCESSRKQWNVSPDGRITSFYGLLIFNKPWAYYQISLSRSHSVNCDVLLLANLAKSFLVESCLNEPKSPNLKHARNFFSILNNKASLTGWLWRLNMHFNYFVRQRLLLTTSCFGLLRFKVSWVYLMRGWY